MLSNINESKNSVLKKGMLVFVTKETLDHKLSDGKKSDGLECFWTSSKVPKLIKRIKYNMPLYFASYETQQVLGYFEVHRHTTDIFGVTLYFYSESWTPINNGEVLVRSQGWRYYPKDLKD